MQVPHGQQKNAPEIFKGVDFIVLEASFELTHGFLQVLVNLIQEALG